MRQRGEKFFKYKSLENIEYIIDMVKSNRIYVPKVSQLNDPLEGICNMNFGFAGCSYYVDTGTVHPHYDSVRNSYGVLSLTTRKDSIVMWTHYAGGFNGICVEFENMGSFITAEPVTYTEELLDSKKIGDSFDIIAYNSLRRKATEWSYEDEYRIIRKIDSAASKYINVKQGEIKRIYIGYMVENDTKVLLDRCCDTMGIETKVVFVNPYKYSIQAISLKQYMDNFKQYNGGVYRCG